MAVDLNIVAASRVGRFELKRVLGRGAQATVWLAWDSRLDREVAVKLMPAQADSDDSTVNQWLQEARSVSRLTHPNIVPVFEADVHELQPYLVFEYVPGPTLSQHARTRGALPAHEAVTLMLGVLDALAAAHAAGVVHRDLKPSNILVDASGRARVMDFGIAARMNDPGGQGQVVGTPGYMSPEAVNAALPAPTMDVFAAGIVLTELLSGQRLVNERDPYRAMSRVVHEDLALPGGLRADVDDTLRSVLLRALARDLAQRWKSVQLLRDALADWLAPEPAAAPTTVQQPTARAGAGAGTLDFLLRRMRHKSDFPALSDSVLRIRRVASSDNESLTSLSNEILKDVALTNKLLRVVNTAHFGAVGGDGVSTVSRAVALIGFAGVRNMAMSLVLLEHMQNKAHASQLQDEFLRALLAGTLAGELGRHTRDAEEAFIAAMYLNLGRLLAEFYLAEEAQQVRDMVCARTPRGQRQATEESASLAVLGISYEQLGIGVARTWGLPDSLQRAMRKPVGEPPLRVPDQPAERLRWLSQAANRITDTLLASGADSSAESTGERLALVAQQHARVLGVSVVQIEAATLVAQQRMAELVNAMDLHVPPSSPMHRLLAPPAPPAEPNDHGDPGDPVSIGLRGHALQATVVMTQTQVAARTHLDSAAEMLAAGVQDITNTMVEDFKLNEVLRMVLETIYRALGLRRVVFCMRDNKTGELTGRFGLGDDAPAVAARFKVALKGEVTLFSAVCLKNVDTLISDATLPSIAARLPAWYREGVNAPAFLLLPLQMKSAPFGLIYADKAQPGAIELGERELSLVRALRNQAVMAFKHAI